MPRVNGADSFSTVNVLLNVATLIVGSAVAISVAFYARRYAKQRGTDAASERLVNVLEAELLAVRGRADRLHTDLEQSQRAVAELAVRPDMSMLVEQLAAFHKDLVGQLKELFPPLATIDRRLDGHEKTLGEMTKTLQAIEGRLSSLASDAVTDRAAAQGTQ